MSGSSLEHGGGHEQRDVTFRPIVAASIGLTVVIVLVFLGMGWLYRSLAAREARRSEPESSLAAEFGRREPPAPRLQAAPIRDLEELRHAEDAVLHGYAWVDRQAGIVRIPIDRAMELLATEGTQGASRGDGP